ncbi:Cupin domain-containing protein [Sphingobacterium allocomposti]|uniref:Cupin domain-containing protein n=1 Tax=Sphingobacterium allocomposti TaxID=415956 RepID=A0A5S5D818_9SPHI|nr:cupin domain-containing protein [Sphingobacterium composti Yoo et al. 2007 non Ten et al. 2007]TYP92233.1 Cupin domain-containing protein [Sphingobacterium composti Yoo et al. 2007 non Ten et al. 2007]
MEKKIVIVILTVYILQNPLAYMTVIKIEEQQALEKLKRSGKEFIPLLAINQLAVEIYKPALVDNQQPHDRDEFYLVISGHGRFEMNGETTSFKAGDLLFVPAYADHRFIDFSADFVTWVFFIGQDMKADAPR